MSTIIREFYEDNKIPGILMKQKMSKFAKNNDIALEFEYWIKNKSYNMDNAVTIEGYTAQKLADASEYLDGEGAFMMLIELRDNPQKALEQINKGFRRK